MLRRELAAEIGKLRAAEDKRQLLDKAAAAGKGAAPALALDEAAAATAAAARDRAVLASVKLEPLQRPGTTLDSFRAFTVARYGAVAAAHRPAAELAGEAGARLSAGPHAAAAAAAATAAALSAAAAAGGGGGGGKKRKLPVAEVAAAPADPPAEVALARPPTDPLPVYSMPLPVLQDVAIVKASQHPLWERLALEVDPGAAAKAAALAGAGDGRAAPEHVPCCSFFVNMMTGSVVRDRCEKCVPLPPETQPAARLVVAGSGAGLAELRAEAAAPAPWRSFDGVVRGGMLCEDMGLGKTLECIGVVCVHPLCPQPFPSVGAAVAAAGDGA